MNPNNKFTDNETNRNELSESEIKMLYKENVQRTAPDMERLWSRIERTIDENGQKEADTADSASRGMIETNRDSSRRMAKLTAWAAAAVLIVSVGALALNREKPAKDNTDNTAKTEQYTAGGNDSMAEGGAAEQLTETAPPIERTEYSALPLAHSGIKTADYKPSGDEYFAESRVLEKTSEFIDVRVQYAEEHTHYCTYTLKVIRAYLPDGEEEGTTLTLDSASPLLLAEGGEYLLPVYTDSKGLHLVFENAPQIEYTQDGRVVFHNGWYSLGEGSAECIYPENKYDEFFFDRMRIADAGNVKTLIERWRSL